MKINLLQDYVQVILSAIDLSHKMKTEPTPVNEKIGQCHNCTVKITEVATSVL